MAIYLFAWVYVKDRRGVKKDACERNGTVCTETYVIVFIGAKTVHAVNKLLCGALSSIRG
jgi:hypothetical protein